MQKVDCWIGRSNPRQDAAGKENAVDERKSFSLSQYFIVQYVRFGNMLARVLSKIPTQFLPL